MGCGFLLTSFASCLRTSQLPKSKTFEELWSGATELIMHRGAPPKMKMDCRVQTQEHQTLHREIQIGHYPNPLAACEWEGFCLKWPFFNRRCRHNTFTRATLLSSPRASNLLVFASLLRRNREASFLVFLRNHPVCADRWLACLRHRSNLQSNSRPVRLSGY